MPHRDAYRNFAETAPDLPLFMQPWYLDAVCVGGSWDALLVQKAGRVVAVMPYFLKQKWGWRYITMPVLGKWMGPYLLPEYRTLKWEMRLYKELLAQLPPGLAAFEQNFHYGVTNWLPFYWQAYRQTTCYSYILPLDAPEAAIFNNIEVNYQKKIRAAQARLQVHHDLPLAELHRLLGQSFERQGLGQPLDFDFLQAYYRVLQNHQAARLFFASDPASGQLHAAALLAWDAGSAYYLISGDDPVLRRSGAGVLLQWEAIRYAKNVLNLPVFDFEGSMMPNIEQGRRDFGAQQRAYFRVWRAWSMFWKLRWLSINH